MNTIQVRELRALKLRLAAIFLLATAALASTALAYYRHHRAHLITDAEELLRATAVFKTDQIRNWRQDLLDRTASLLDSPILSIYLKKLAAAPGDRETASMLKLRLESFVSHNQFDSAILADAAGNIRISAGKQAAKKLCPEAASLLRSFPRAPVMGDLHQKPGSGEHGLHIAAHAAGGLRDGLYLLLSVRPETQLYPLVKKWPGPSPSGETLLARREGEHVVFLNELRHVPDTALKLRLPLKPDLPAAMAASGRTGIVHGTDYRGRPVLAYLSALPEFGWHMVTKVDMEEVLANTGDLELLLLLGVLMFMGLLAAAAYAVFSAQTLRLSGELGKVSAERLKALQDFEVVFRTSADGKSITSIDGTVKPNLAFCEMTGYTEGELRAKNWRDITPKEDIAPTEAILKELLEGRKDSARFEKRYIRKGGGIIWGDVSVAVHRGQDGKPEYFITSVMDITAKKKAELALLEAQHRLEDSESRLKFSLEASEIGAWDLDLRDHSAFRSPRHDRIFGYPALLPEWTYEKFLGHVIEEDRAEVDRKFKAAIASGGDWEFECRITRADGERRWIWAKGRHQRDRSGALRRMAGIVQDITTRKAAEAELRESEEFTRAVMDNLPMGIAVNSTSKAVKFQYINERFPEFYRTTREALKEPDAFWEAVYEDPAFRERIRKRVLEDCASGDPARMRWEDVPLTRGGDTRYITARNIPLPGKDLMISMVEDVTERKLAELRIEQLNRDLVQKNKEMENFLYVTTHDLRSPLVNIQGFSRNLTNYLEEFRAVCARVTGLPEAEHARLREVLTEKAPEALGFILDSSRKMDALITALLKVSRAGRLELTPERLDMRKLLGNVLATLRFQTQEAEAAITIGEVPDCFADAGAASQIFTNLLDNALKHRKPGRKPEIWVSGDISGDKAVYTVEDNGPGIPPEDLAKIWDIFYRPAAPGANRGEGIGLPLVRRLAERGGGSASAGTGRTGGAAFIITLPRARRS